jgi:hypothetical protein
MRILGANGLGSRRYGLWVIFLFVAILSGFPALPAHGADTLWGCLIYASDAGQCNSLPQRLSSYDARMSSAFGYSRFCLMAQRQTPLQAQKEAGLVFSGDLKIILTSLTGVSDGKYLIRLLFVQGEEPVMETQARLSRDSPLFIRGPNWRDGQIIIVVMVAT